MKRLLFLLFIFTLQSCKDHFEPKNYQGSWVPVNTQKEILPLPHIGFHNDSIFFTDAFTFSKGGTFKIVNEKIHIQLHDEELCETFSFRKRDSSIFIGNTEYNLITQWLQDYKANYQLISIETDNKISSDSIFEYDSGFHLFRDATDSLKIKLNDRYGRLDDIPRFVFRTDSFRYPENLIYLGQNTALKDLINCYYQLALVNNHKATLVTNLSIVKNVLNP